MHRITTKHTSQTTDRRNTVAKARPLVRSLETNSEPICI